MASTDPERRKGPNGRGKAGRVRPPIWTGGRQRPPFDRAAFWRVTKANSRDLLWPVLARIGERFERGAHAVACGFGATMVARLGKAARALPPRRSVVGALRGTGLWLLVGADRIDRIGRPPAADAEEADGFAEDDLDGEARPSRILGPELAATTRVIALRPTRPAPRSRAPEPEAEIAPLPEAEAEVAAARPEQEPLRAALTGGSAGGEDDPLLAIRAMMRSAAAPAPVPKKPQLPPPPEPDPITGLAALPPLAPPEPPGPGPNLLAFGKASGIGIFILSLPVGALMAGVSYLRGEDLRLRDTT